MLDKYKRAGYILSYIWQLSSCSEEEIRVSQRRRALFRLYWAARHAVAPGLRYSQYWYEDALCRAVTPQTRWLELGCGHQILPDWRLEVERELVSRAAQVAGVNPDKNAVAKHRSIRDIRIATAEALPFPANSFDLVTANMVVEHLADPAKAFREIFRVLAPGGAFLFHSPNVDSYVIVVSGWLPDPVKQMAARILDGRKGEDVYPTHYRCNSEHAISEVAEASGFELASIRFIPTEAVFALVLPLAVLELLWIRRTMREDMASYRTNIITTLRKPGP